MSSYQKVIAVDLDGTLAFYDHWRGPMDIGYPILPMVERVRKMIDAGHKVVIFSARITNDDDTAVEPARVTRIQDWLESMCHLPRLEVTNIKRKEFSEMWDDRAVRVIPNTGTVPVGAGVSDFL